MPTKKKDLRSDHRLPWFVADRPISTSDQDAFSHTTVAAVLTTAVAESTNGTIVGLMGRFGAGKTSVVNLAAALLGDVHGIDVVHVSADKHSGEARSRNIVHSVAGAMVDTDLLKEHDVRAILRRLRGTDSIAVPEPEQMRLSRLLSDREGNSLRDVWTTIGVTLALFVILLGASVLVGGRPATLLTGLGAAVVAFGAMKVAYDHIVDSLFEIPKRTESTPRAEAADDVEIVFEQLVTKHIARRHRPLVVFIDDIDRLGESDLLDAMRSIKSLQAVPRGNEPRFVVSCDAGVLLKALSDAARTSSGARALDPEAGIAEEASGPNDTARDYLDKFFHLRIEMPPNVVDDMPNLVRRLVPTGHPVRDHLTDEQVQRVLLVLARGDVRSPRRLIHRTNRFLSAFRIALDRETAGSTARLHPGDVTGRPVALARLAVLEVEFPWFHSALMRDEGLLAAADRLARHEDTSQTDDELLTKHEVAKHAEWDVLRRYLVSTWRSTERSAASIVPLLYLAEPESGRTLGNERLAALLGAVRAGDVPVVESGLSELAAEHVPLAAAEIAAMLGVLTSAETRDAVSGAVATLERLGDQATPVAVAAAELVHDLGSDALQPDEFRQLLRHLPSDNRAATLRTFAGVPDGEADDDTNHRMLVASEYLVEDPIAVALPDAVAAYLDTIHERTGWDAAPAWVSVAVSLDRSAHSDLIDNHLVPAMYRLARGDESVRFDDTARDLARLVGSMNPGARGELAEQIRGMRSLSDDSARLLVATFGAGYAVTNVNDALRLSDALSKDLDDLESVAVRHLVASVNTWKDSTFKRAENEPEDAPARYCADAIGESLALVVARSDDRALIVLAEEVETLAASDRATAAVATQVVATLDSIPDDVEVGEALRTLAASLFATGVEAAVEAGGVFLGWYASAGELSPRLRSILPLVDILASNSASKETLASAAAAWREAAADPAAAFPRSRPVEAFVRLAATDAATAETAADGALPSVTSRIQQGADVADNLSLVLRLPWGAERTAEAMTLVEQQVDQLGDITAVVPLAVRAARHGVALLDTTQQRLADAVLAEPAALMPEFARMARAFDAPTRQRVVVGTAGTSDTTREVLASVDTDELVSILVAAVRGGRSEAIASAVPPERLSGSAADALRRLVADGVAVDGETVAEFRLAAEDVSSLQEHLVGAVDDEHARARAALFVLTALGSLPAELGDQLDSVAAARLGGWTPETAGLFADLRNASPLPDVLAAAVAELIASDDDEQRQTGLRVRERTGHRRR